jgi:CheY-like chemotaxis protein
MQSDIGGSSGRAWLTEAARLARALGEGDTVCGLVDEATVLVARVGPGRALADGLAALARAGDGTAPAWRAGVVDADAAAPVPALRAAAEAALAAAALAGETVHLHEPTDDTRAPDVVLVEDDVALSDMLQFALRAAGFTYRAYASGPEALDALLGLERRVGRVLVLLDVDLPGMDGHTLHERLRLERPGQFAVVFCSVHGSEAEQLRAIEAGALDWLTKPISLRVLVAKVRRWRDLTLAG